VVVFNEPAHCCEPKALGIKARELVGDFLTDFAARKYAAQEALFCDSSYR
jgi:hypothetical protein